MEDSTSTNTTAPNVEVVNQADCYFYYYSSCHKGKSCPFRHEPSALRNETMCVYWLKGNCNKPQCFYRHMEINKPRDKIQCFFESQPGGCKKLHCPFLHNNVLDQPREEDVAKNPDIILPVKDSEAEYQPDESDSKKLNANISAQIRLQRQMFESEDTSDIPSPPVTLRQPIIVPLYDGESDSESLYCPSPNKSAGNVISTMDPETDWELERLKQIQVEEGNILGYARQAEEVANNCRQAIVISSASSDSYENEVYISEEEIIEEHEMEEDVKDAVHRRLQFSGRNSATQPTNFKVSFSNNYKSQMCESSRKESVKLQRKVLSGVSSTKAKRRPKDFNSQSSDDEETISSNITIKRVEGSMIVGNHLDHVKKPLSVKERLGLKNSHEKVQDMKLGGLSKRQFIAGQDEHRLDRHKMESSRNSGTEKKIRIGLSKSSIQDGPLRHLGLDNNSIISKGIKEMRLGFKESKSDIQSHRLKANINESRRKIDSKLPTKRISIINSKPLKESRVIVDNRVCLNEAIPASKLRIVKERPDLKMTSVNANANLIIKSLADIKAERKFTSTVPLKRKISPNLIDVPLSTIIQEKAVSADRLKNMTEVGDIKIKTLAQIKAEKGTSNRIKLNKPYKRPISPIRFDPSPTKKHKPIDANFMTTSVKLVNDSLSNSSFKPIAKTVVNDAFGVGSRKLTLKKTPPKVPMANENKNWDLKTEVKSCIINLLKEEEYPVSRKEKSRTLPVSSNRDSNSDTLIENVTNGKKNSLYSSIENFMPEVLSQSFEVDDEEKVISNGSKPIVKLNDSNNDISKDTHKRVSVGVSNKSVHRLDSFLDEDELLGEDLEDSFSEDEEINEEELLL